MRNLFFVLFLLLPSVCFGQAFNSVIDSSQYPPRSDGAIIPIHDNQAILMIRYEPRNGSIVGVSIIPSVSFNSGADTPISATTYGWSYYFGEVSAPGSYRIDYCVISPETLYTRSSAYAAGIVRTVQQFLIEKNLGTVQQRAAYIASFKLSNVTLVDTSQIGQSIVEMLGPWAVIGLGLAIALFGIDLGTRSQKKLLGPAAKEARSAERKVINAQIRADGVAQAYRTRLSLLAQAKRGDIKLKGYSRFGARQAFYDTARDYADYKKSKGWTL